MEDIISLVFTGCRLAQELESDLSRLNGTAELMEKCEAINAVFTAVIHGLRAVHDPQSLVLLAADEAAAGGAVGVGPMMMPSSSMGKEVVLTEDLIPYSDSGGSGRGGGVVDEGRGELRLPAFGVKAAGGGGEGSSLQKSRKRKDETGKRTIEVAAPMHGNTEIPPDDGYTWRKYGQKEILGSQFTRGYYRCTHQRLYNCPAKKQVQRLNHNPRIFQVIYRGDHICHMSSTAPASAIPPPPPPPPPATTSSTASASNVASLQMSLPSGFIIELTSQPLMGIPSTSTTTSIATTMPFFDPNFNMYGGQVTNTNVGVRGGGASTSNVDGANVVDMADTMFNVSAGGGGDSIDFIFSKWGEPSEGKH